MSNKISRRSLLKIASGLSVLGVVGRKTEDDPEISAGTDAISPSLDISVSRPKRGCARFVGIYLDWDDNTIKCANGSTARDIPDIALNSPKFPDDAILSAIVRINGDQTTFSEIDLVDTRPEAERDYKG